MKTVRNLSKVIICLVLLCLIALPFILIYQISRTEMSHYEAPDAPVLHEIALGKIEQAHRMDVSEYITIKGVFESNARQDLELDVRDPSQIRWNVASGDEVVKDQVLGTYGEEEIVSPLDGTLMEIHAYSPQEDSYLRFQLYNPVMLKCYLTDKQLALITGASELHTGQDESVTIEFVSRKKKADGTTEVHLVIDTDRFTYGEEISGLDIYTGTVYPNVLVLPLECLYQLNPGEGNPWYVRQVTQDGLFVRECEVKLGYHTNDFACVIGISDDQFFDAGYKSALEGMEK